MRYLSAVLAILALAAPAAAQDLAGSKDHPMFTRFPNYSSRNTTIRSSAPTSSTLGKRGDAEGGGPLLAHRLRGPEDKKGGAIQIARNYGNLLVSKGGAKLLEDVNAEAGRRWRGCRAAPASSCGSRSRWPLRA